MKYMLDSNICIYFINGKPQNVLAKLRENLREGIAISAITLMELEHGVFKSERPDKNTDALNKFLSVVKILPFDDGAAVCAGRIKADLQRKGNIIGAYDILIAGHALSEGLILVTNNTREFARVPGLKLEDWTL